MAAVNEAKVLTGGPDQLTTGAISSAPLGTTLPTAPAEALEADFEAGGFISDAGLTVTPTRSTTDIKDWSLTVIRKILESFDTTLAWTYIEVNEQSLAAYFGDDNVKTTAATSSAGTVTTVTVNADELPRKSWAFRMKDGANKILIVVPVGQVTETGEIAFVKGAPIMLPVTLTTYPDEAGNHLYIYTDDGVVTA